MKKIVIERILELMKKEVANGRRKAARNQLILDNFKFLEAMVPRSLEHKGSYNTSDVNNFGLPVVLRLNTYRDIIFGE